ncbi:MAG TPA: branched-chain amino acid ABC transporter permease [Gammaproteobacteria bacterium]|nr:branched-chain amino acid ABC transporter permease [Gammaproteobacteria bacterium]
MNYFFHILIYLEIYIIVSLSLNLIVGYCGILHIAQAAFFGIGAYTTALLMESFNYGFFPSLIIAGVIASLLSVIVSIPAWRFRGDYFVMISLAVQATLYAMFYNLTDITKGSYGFSGISKPNLFGVTFYSNYLISALYAIIFFLVVYMMLKITRSPFGRSLQAMRDDEVSARSIGIETRFLKVQAFLASAFIVALAGGMYASYVTFIDPSSFSLSESILMLSMLIIGGTGNIKGPITGAIILVLLPELLRFLSIPDALAANVKLLIYGLLLMVIMRLRPQGVNGIYRLQ